MNIHSLPTKGLYLWAVHYSWMEQAMTHAWVHLIAALRKINYWQSAAENPSLLSVWISHCVLGNSGRVNALSANPGFQKYTNPLNNVKTSISLRYIKAWNKHVDEIGGKGSKVKTQCCNLFLPFRELYWLTLPPPPPRPEVSPYVTFV